MVSSHGRVMSKRRLVTTSKGTKKWIDSRILKQWKMNTGYVQVETYKDGIMSRHLVHRLVLGSFSPDKELVYVNHIDENRANNRLDNLEHSDPLHNAHHSLRTWYVLRAPDGAEHTFKNLSKFCREHSHLNKRAIHKAFAGKQAHHKGWRPVRKWTEPRTNRG